MAQIKKIFFRIFNRLVLLAAIIFGLNIPAAALWGNNTNVNNPVSTAANNQLSAKSVADGNGGIITAWLDDRDVYTSVYAQKLDANGDPQWTLDGVPISTNASSPTDLDVASDGAGGAVIIWYDVVARSIHAQKVNSFGSIQWTLNGLVVAAANVTGSPKVVSDGSGGGIIAWTDFRTGDNDIYVQRVAGNALLWTSTGVRLTTNNKPQQTPAIATDGAGGAIVVWEDYQSGSNWDISAQRVDASGVSQWPDGGIGVTVAAGDQYSSTISVDGSNGAYIAWLDRRNGVTPYIYTRRLNDAGAPLWPERPVCDNKALLGSPQIAYDGVGNAIITWHDNRVGTAYNTDIYAQKIAADGVLQWTTNGVAVSTASYEQQDPQVIADGNGGTIIAWDDNRVYGNWNIYAQRLNDLGAGQWNINGVAVSTAPGNQRHMALVSDTQNGVLLAWPDGRNGSDVYAQRVYADGHLSTGYVVTPSAGPNGSISPNTPQSIPYTPTSTLQFTVTPDLGYVAEVGGTCGGNLVGNIYTTNGITSDCTVAAAFVVPPGSVVTPTPGPKNTLIAGGFEHSLTAKGDGTVVAWGNNSYGEATPPAGLTGVIAVAAGDNHSLALKSDGTVVAWGSNSQNQTTVPTGLNGVTSIAARGSQSLALKNDGTVVGWGSYASSIPPDLDLVVAIAAGETYSLVVRDKTREVVVIGSPSGTPMPAGLNDVLSLSAWSHSLAVKSDGSVVAWGSNTSGQATVPAGLSGVIQVAAGSEHSLALKDDGTVVAWGSNAQGQTSVPAGLSNVVAIAAGRYHSLALKADGSVVTWGYNPLNKLTVPSGLNLKPFHGQRGTITPEIPRVVAYQATQQFTVLPETGYEVSMAGDCGGSLVGNVYTTNLITSPCHVDASFVISTYTVTASVPDQHAILDKPSVVVDHGTTASFTVTADNGYTTDTVVGGDCPAGSWVGTTYTTGVIVGNCALSFSNSINSYTVNASVTDGHGQLDSTTKVVQHGSNASFTVTPDPGYTTDVIVSGDCPAGSWSGGTYTTGGIVGPCSLGFSHTINSYQVTPNVVNHGSVTPSTSQMIDFGTSAQFVVTADDGWLTDAAVGGTCPLGSWSGDVYTTGAIDGDCSVAFGFIQGSLISVLVSAGGTTSPMKTTIVIGTTASFTPSAKVGHSLSAMVGGSCPPGSWSGSNYVTGTVSGNCTLQFYFNHDTLCTDNGTGSIIIDSDTIIGGEEIGCASDLPIVLGPNLLLQNGSRVTVLSTTAVDVLDGTVVEQGAVLDIQTVSP